MGHKEEAAQKVAQLIVKMALDKGAQDNITCLAVKL